MLNTTILSVTLGVILTFICLITCIKQNYPTWLHLHLTSLTRCILKTRYCCITTIYYLKYLGALQSVIFLRRGLFKIWTMLSLITSVNGLIYPSFRLSAISSSLVKSLALTSFFHQPNLQLFALMYLSHPLMKLSGIFRKISVIIRACSMIYAKVQRKF